MSKRFTYSKAPLRRVTEVQFCVWSPEAITSQSMTQEYTTTKGESVPAGVTKAVTFVDGEGVYGGVNDPRMGGDNDRDDVQHAPKACVDADADSVPAVPATMLGGCLRRPHTVEWLSPR